MPDRKRFLRLLRAELEDMDDDLRLLEDRYRARFEASEIGSYVFQENDAFLRRERDSIVKFLKIVDGIDFTLYKGLSEIETRVLALSRESVSSHEDPEAFFIVLKRKIDKIHIYLAKDESESGCP